MKTVLVICDPAWSTGNIAKCLTATLRDWTIELHDWANPFTDDKKHDAVVCMSITGPARNFDWRTTRIATVLCGPGEMTIPEVTELELPPGTVLAGVSCECAALLRSAHATAAAVHVTPGFAHPNLFGRRRRPVRPIRRAGFVGLPVPQNMQVSGLAKRPEMFKEICERAGVEAVFSGHDYRYEDMQQFYDSIDVLVSTSAHEGGPFSPLEAIACGVPALSTDVGVIHDIELPGRFATVEECVALIPTAQALLPEQSARTERHTLLSIAAWNAFLHHAATVRTQPA